ncbi:MAG: transposase [Clostridiales bacterium]|nr:transposase [Clostridiales bacterium]
MTDYRGIFFIVINCFDLSAREISQIYRLRWRIVFFKWTKQYFNTKRFYDNSYNAVLNQIYTALILCCVLKLLHIQIPLVLIE